MNWLTQFIKGFFIGLFFYSGRSKGYVKYRAKKKVIHNILRNK